MSPKQLEECDRIINWCSENINSLMRNNFLPDIVNICKSTLFPSGSEHISDIVVTVVIESNFI